MDQNDYDIIVFYNAPARYLIDKFGDNMTYFDKYALFNEKRQTEKEVQYWEDFKTHITSIEDNADKHKQLIECQTIIGMYAKPTTFKLDTHGLFPICNTIFSNPENWKIPGDQLHVITGATATYVHVPPLENVLTKLNTCYAEFQEAAVKHSQVYQIWVINKTGELLEAQLLDYILKWHTFVLGFETAQNMESFKMYNNIAATVRAAIQQRESGTNA